MNWLVCLSRLDRHDLRRISRLVDLLSTAEPAKADQARAMLSAQPEPATWRDARERVGAVIGYLEQ
jgi:hypothetical protein